MVTFVRKSLNDDKSNIRGSDKMVKSVDLLNKIKVILGKDDILEEDLNNIEELTINKYKLNGKETDIDLEELKFFKNLKTLTLIKFKIDLNIIEKINDNKHLWAIQFSKCDFQRVLPINQKINYVVLDCCENVNLEFINNNETVKIIGTEVDLIQLKQMENIETLYLQDCKIKNVIEILQCSKLKKLNLDGSKIDNKDILKKLNKNIAVSCKEVYHLVGGINI